MAMSNWAKFFLRLPNTAVNVEFFIKHTVKDIDALMNELLGKAVKDSRNKSEVLAKAAGVSLGEIKTIDYSWGELEIYSEPISKMMLDAPMEADEAYDIVIETDDIDIQDTVAIVLEIKRLFIKEGVVGF